MEKFKETAIYYWLFLVVGQSVLETLQFQRLWGKAMDVFMLVALFVLINLGLFQSGQFPVFTLTWNTLIFQVVILILARLLQGILSVPPKLYFNAKKDTQELKDKWEGTVVQTNLVIKEFQEPSAWRIGIWIFNPTAQKVTNLGVELVDLTWITLAGERHSLNVSLANRRFSLGEYFPEPNTILPYDRVLVFLAETDQLETCKFLLPQYFPQDVLEESHNPTGRVADVANFELKLRVNAYIDTRPLREQRCKVHVHFERTRDQQIQHEDGTSTHIPKTSPLFLMQGLECE